MKNKIIIIILSLFTIFFFFSIITKTPNSNDITYNLIKNIFDKTNTIEGYKKELNEIYINQLETQKYLENGYNYNIDEINKTRNTFKTEMMIFLKDDKPLERLINDINNLLDGVTVIDKNFYSKLCNIQISRYISHEKDYEKIMLKYGNEQEINDFEKYKEFYKNKYILEGTNLNILKMYE